MWSFMTGFFTSCTSFSVDISFQFSWIYTLGVEFLAHIVTLCLTFEVLPNSLPTWLYHFNFPPGIYETSNFSTSLSTIIIVSLFLIIAPLVDVKW